MQGERQRAIDWEHLVFLLGIVGFLVWFCWDATAASPTFSNLILIAPVAAVALILCVYIGSIEIFRPSATAKATDQNAADAVPSRFRAGSLKAIALLMGLFALFVGAIPYAGFDVASFVFIVATLWLLGERRVMFTLLLALGIAAGISIAALTLLTSPIPMGIAGWLWSAL